MPFFKKLEIIIGKSEVEKYSFHSLRKGAAYTAALSGAQDSQIKAMGRWKSECFQIYTSVTTEEAGEKMTKLIKKLFQYQKIILLLLSWDVKIEINELINY